MSRLTFIIPTSLRVFVVITIMLVSACSGSDGGVTPNTASSENDCVIGTSKIGDCKL